MGRRQSVEQVAEQILESVLASPNQQRRMMSSTFWNQFGYQVRSKERVDSVWDLLRERSVVISVSEGKFGSERKKDWIILSFLRSIPIPEPSPAWFERMMSRKFSSEREVEYFFAMPLLEQLGYSPDRIALAYRVRWQEGSRKRSKEADIVVFADGERQNAHIVVEAKSAGTRLTRADVGQAASYSLHLRAPYYVLTNGEEVRIFHYRGLWRADALLLAFGRDELKEKWGDLYRCLNPETVAEFEKLLQEQMRVIPTPKHLV